MPHRNYAGGIRLPSGQMVWYFRNQMQMFSEAKKKLQKPCVKSARIQEFFAGINDIINLNLATTIAGKQSQGNMRINI